MSNTDTQATPDYNRLARIAEAQARPVWDLDDVALVFNIRRSTLEVVLREHPMPLFTVGRRRHIMQDAAHAWIAEMAAKNVYTEPKTYNLRSSKEAS